MMRDGRFVQLGGADLRRAAMQARIYYCIAAGGVCLLAIFVGIFTPLILFRGLDSNYSTTMESLELDLAFSAAQSLYSSILDGYAGTQALEGYVMSRMTVLPNVSLPPAQRVGGQNFPDFADVAKQLLFVEPNGVVAAMLAPGGVYSHIHPMSANLFLQDTFAPDDPAQGFLPTPQQSVQEGRVAYIGPYLSTGPFVKGSWALVVRRPIYNRTDYDEAGWDTFWGFTQTVLNISDILQTPLSAITQLQQQHRYGAIDYVISVRDAKTGKLLVVESSRSRWTQAQLKDFIRSGSSMDVTPNHPFTVTVRGLHYGKWLSPDNVVIVVSTVLAGSMLCLAIFIALLLYCTRVYDGAAHAPKLAPFAMLTIGPCRGEELWELAPDEMVGVTDRLGKVLAKQMERHHAYQIQQVHPLTTSYVTRSVAAAVQMAFDAIEEVQSSPIDEPLRRLLGDDCGLLLSYAVHWCNDAVVRLDPMEGGYRYEGPDVVYGGRMWAFAAPSVVTASEAVAEALPRFGLRCITAAPHRRVNVVRSRSVCGATGDGEMNGVGNSSSSSAGGAATIYVPFPAPTTVEATAGMGGNNAGSAAAAHHKSSSRSKDIALPPQTLLTLVDTRRPVLLAARAAAPAPRHHHSSNEVPIQVDAQIVVQPVHHVFVQDTDHRTPLTYGHSSASFHSSEEDGSSAALPAPLVVTTGTDTNLSYRTSMNLVRSSMMIQGDGVTRALLRPVIPHALDVALHAAFDYQAITLGMSYKASRVLVYYFYSSYKILFRPLAAPERHNIYRRLVTAFGVPPQGILEHLAARCAIRCLQQSAKLRQLTVQKHAQEAAGPLNDEETPLPGITRRAA